MIAIRTPILVTMCINSGLDIVKKNYELQDGDCTHIFTKSAGRTKKTWIRYPKRRLLQDLIFLSGISMKKESFCRLVHLCAYDEQERPHRKTERNNAEIERILFDSHSEWNNE